MPLLPVSVLIVDDVPEVRELFVQLLEGLPEIRALSQAANVWEARLELTRRRPGLVILDEVLPGESSLDFVSELAAEKIPVLLVTGLRDRQEPLPQGAYARLLKPDGRGDNADRQRFQKAIQQAFQPSKG